MAATRNYLAVDLGAESGRGLLGRFDGECLKLEEGHRFPNGLANSAALPASGTVTVNSGGILAVDAGAGNGLFTNATSGAGSIGYVLGTETWNPGSVFGIDTTYATGGTFTYSGSISGNEGLIKLGPGELILSGSDTFDGGTTVEAGTLIATNSNAIPRETSLTVGPGGIFVFDPSQAGAGAVPAPGRRRWLLRSPSRERLRRWWQRESLRRQWPGGRGDPFLLSSRPEIAMEYPMKVEKRTIMRRNQLVGMLGGVLVAMALGAAAAEPTVSVLGNVFLTTEDVVLPIVTSGDTVAWKITDFWGAVCGEGEEKVVDTRARITPPEKRNGYFLVRLTLTKGGQVVADQFTSFAVIPPIDSAALKDSPFGVMSHFAQGWETDIMPLLVKAGISSIRDEAYWGHIEKKKGQFVFPEQFDKYLAEAKRVGIDPLLVMTFGNPLYDGGKAPATPAGREAYARYGEELLKHYGSQIRWLEVWNEYNGTWCGGEAEKDRPKYYAEMIKAAYPKIKALRPDVKVLGCAAVVIPLPYLEGIFKHGGLQAMDAVVIHPYRGQPEGVEVEVAELQKLIQKYNDGKDKPIWVTETGSWDGSEYDWEQGKGLNLLGRSNIARYLVRQYALLLFDRHGRKGLLVSDPRL